MASAFTRKYHALLDGLRRGFQPADYRANRRRLAAAEEAIRRLAALHYPSVVNADHVKDFYRSRELGLRSQYGEDGLLLYLFSKVGTPTRRFVEFGVQDGRQCCSASLLADFGWNGLMIEGNPRDAAAIGRHYREEHGIGPDRLTVVHAFVTSENINALIGGAGLTGEIDLLSIDVDGNDYWIWRAIDVVRPRVVVVEYNASLPADRPLVIRYDPQFVRASTEPESFYHGASLAAFAELGRRKGYSLVCCDSSGVNAYFVRDDARPADLRCLTPAEAYYPLAARSRFGPPARQYEAIAGRPFETG
jgi:hypothetical protein